MKRFTGIAIALLIGFGAALHADEDPGSDTWFEEQIRPLLVERCIKCHGDEKASGGLRLDSEEFFGLGGNSGNLVDAGQPPSSLLLQALRRVDGVPAMPPDSALPEKQIAAIEQWIAKGAKWPKLHTKLDASKHWAFEPVSKPALPVLPISASSPIDLFVQQKLNAAGIEPLGRADRAILLRRVSYDLIGLPPTFEEISDFVNDQSPNAWEKVVDRLLASPAYGERWGRHWLDVVRYADTAGENSDHPLPHAWRYRNWVLDAFNSDKRYNDFISEQIAGDILASQLEQSTGCTTEELKKSYADLTVATGYLAIARRFGHDIDKDMHLTMEDTIDTLGKSLLGLTLGCARCHSHKYDPISDADYYALYGIFESTKFAYPGCEPFQQPRDLVDLLPKAERERQEIEYRRPMEAINSEIKHLNERELVRSTERASVVGENKRELLSTLVADAGEVRFDQSTNSSLNALRVSAGQMILLTITPNANHGADSTAVDLQIVNRDLATEKWVLRDDLLREFSKSNPIADQYGNANTWALFDLRKGLELLPDFADSLEGKVGLAAWRNGELPSVFVNLNEMPVRVWTELPARSVYVHPAADGNVGIGWIAPKDMTLDISGRVADAHPGVDGVGVRLELLPTDFRKSLQDSQEDSIKRIALRKELNRLQSTAPAKLVAYSVQEGSPKNARLQMRGDPEKLADEVPRRWLELFGAKQVSQTSGSGRLELANWLTDPTNPLLARVFVNRIWGYHFGHGIVRTSNDFGTRGELPTHPELLDWMTSEFVDSGWSIKRLHRLILLSDTYCRNSRAHEAIDKARMEHAHQLDPVNRLLWSYSRHRLDAEQIRDSMLQVSQRLDRSEGQAHPFPPESTWSFSQHNPFSAIYDSNQRSVYLMVARNRRHPFLGLFDGADPNASTPLRSQTTVPTQALYFMNDSFVHGTAEEIARSAIASSSDERARVEYLLRACHGRGPMESEVDDLLKFVSRFKAIDPVVDSQSEVRAWAAVVRVLIGSNEFLYVE